MNCPDVQDLLSAYYDGELAGDARLAVDVHLRECADCAGKLKGFQQLSHLARGLDTLDSIPPNWQQIERQLDREAAPQPREAARRRLLSMPSVLAAAATLTVAVGGWFVYEMQHSPVAHQHLAVDFRQYLVRFQSNPIQAQEFLAEKYDGEALDLDRAAERLGYRPAVADGLPAGLSLVSSHVMKMPCCTCIGCLCRRDDGSKLAIFEHDEEQPTWFGGRPSVAATCCGRRCSLMQADGELIVGWQTGRRHITVIGARDLEEINRLVAWLEDPKRATTRMSR